MGEHDFHRQRLRRRATRTELDGFEPHEMLELLISYAIPRGDVNPVAHALIERFGSFSGVLDARKEELMQVKGVGERTATLLTSIPHFFAYYQRDRWGEKPRLTTRRMAGEYCTTMFARQQVESMVLVCLDTHKAVLAYETLFTGTVDETPLYTRAVVECALRHNAHTVMLVHNHPSGVTNPSKADIIVSQMVQNALNTVDIELLDHFVVAGSRYTSLRDADRKAWEAGLSSLDHAADSDSPR